MRPDFDPAQSCVVSAADFLAHFPGRGRPVELRHLGLHLYGIKDCWCFGRESQSLAPAFDKGALPFFFKESCPYPANERNLAVVAARALEHGADIREIDEAVPLFPEGAFNLWHFTCQSLPKVLALEEIGYGGSYIVPHGTGGKDDSVIAESLALFGIGPERLLFSGPVYRIRRMMLPQRISGYDLAENMPLTALLREKILAAVGREPGGKRLYVRRIGRRRAINEDEVLDVLKDFGFSVMTPEDLSLESEWRAMTNVECSVMVHGANTALSLLQPEGSAFVEMFGNRYAPYCNLHAVRLLHLRYYPLMEELDMATHASETAPANVFFNQGFAADIYVDPLHLRIALETLCA